MRKRHRLQLAALVCGCVAIAAGIVAYTMMPSVTGSVTTLAGEELLSYGYALLAGVGLVSSAIFAGLAVRLDPPGAQGRCSTCRQPIPTGMGFCPACGCQEASTGS